MLESCSSRAECILGISVITGVEGGELSKEMCQGWRGEASVRCSAPLAVCGGVRPSQSIREALHG